MVRASLKSIFEILIRINDRRPLPEIMASNSQEES
jgi:hypothetical protein